MLCLFWSVERRIFTISSNRAWGRTPTGENWPREATQICMVGESTHDLTLPPSGGDEMNNVVQRKIQWGEGWAEPDVAVISSWLPLCTTKARRPLGESPATCVQWCGWGLVQPTWTCTALEASNLLHKLLLQRGRTRLGIWVISLIFFITFNPASIPSSCLLYTFSSSRRRAPWLYFLRTQCLC